MNSGFTRPFIGACATIATASGFTKAVRKWPPGSRGQHRRWSYAYLQNPQRGHSARFESADLADVLRIAVPGFPVFALFYRWDGQTLTVITLEHAAQDLPARLANLLLTG